MVPILTPGSYRKFFVTTPLLGLACNKLQGYSIWISPSSVGSESSDSSYVSSGVNTAEDVDGVGDSG